MKEKLIRKIVLRFFILILVFSNFSVIAQDKFAYIVDNQKPLPPPEPDPIITTTCKPLPPLLGHAFNINDFKRLASNIQKLVIVGHGIRINDDRFERIMLHKERCPIFVSEENPIQDIRLHDLQKVLEGKERYWNELGGVQEPISLYLHGGILQKKSFETLIQNTLGITSNNLKSANPTYAANYEELIEIASKDKSALAIGIKEWYRKGLRTVLLDGIDVKDRAKADFYLLKIPIYVYTRRDSAKSIETRDKWIKMVYEDANRSK